MGIAALSAPARGALHDTLKPLDTVAAAAADVVWRGGRLGEARAGSSGLMARAASGLAILPVLVFARFARVP
ncbi:MAG: hypothetical protein IE922_13425 [Sphingomonadales bacterium]|nr:hypothetical protein [Sphingomonadales bacterium]